MNENINAEFNSTMESLIKTISGFSDEQFNIIPFEGSWTAGQVSEHVLKSIEGVPNILHGTAKPAGRNPDEKEPALKGIFLDFETKFKSPKEVLPTDEPKDKEAMLDTIAAVCDEIKRVIETEDLSLLCTDVPFPQIGELTRYEWISFVNLHTRRHTRQMNNIYNKLELITL